MGDGRVLGRVGEVAGVLVVGWKRCWLGEGGVGERMGRGRWMGGKSEGRGKGGEGEGGGGLVLGEAWGG